MVIAKNHARFHPGASRSGRAGLTADLFVIQTTRWFRWNEFDRQNWLSSRWKGALVLTEPPPENLPAITELTRQQRRVLGVLLEKAFTTPDQYPLTPKALTAGCNQKSNRSPLVEYDEVQVLDTLDQLRDLGLVGEVHTDSGRTSRFRHYMRHRFKLSEAQIAILTELMLRGRQRLGELRTRASRMVEIGSLEKLREELNGLLDQGLLQTTGDLERRGTEVDHNLYRAKENMALEKDTSSDEEPAPRSAPVVTASRSAEGLEGGGLTRLTTLETELEELRAENRELRELMESLRLEMSDMQTAFEDLRRDLGG